MRAETIKNADNILNGQQLTNIGVFRKYVENYLKNNPHIEQKEITNSTVTSEISAPLVFNALATNSIAKDVYAPADKFALAIAGKTTRLTEGKDFSIDWIRWVKGDKDDTSKGYFEITVKAHQSRNADVGREGTHSPVDGGPVRDGRYAGRPAGLVLCGPEPKRSGDHIRHRGQTAVGSG